MLETANKLFVKRVSLDLDAEPYNINPVCCLDATILLKT